MVFNFKLEDKCINAATDVLNKLICSTVDQEKGKKYELFWRTKLKTLLNQKFRFALSGEESKEEFDLFALFREHKDRLTPLVQRTLDITGISLSASAKSVSLFPAKIIARY